MSHPKFVGVFMTEGTSLETWEKVGILERELKLYKNITKNSDWHIKLFVYSKESCKLEDSLLKDNISLVYLYSKASFLWKFRYLQMIFSFILPFLFKSDIKACTILKSNQLWGAWVPAIAAKLTGKKFLLRCGYESLRTAKQANHSGLILFIHKTTNWFSYQLATRIHVASEEDKDFIKNVYSKSYSSKTFIYRNWVDTNIFKPKDTKQNGKILFIGRFTAQKNLHNLIDAVKDLDFCLDLVGSGELENDLKLLAKNHQQKIQFLGRLPNEQLAEIIPQYNLYVLVSNYEGTPKTLIEAMSCGAICLGTNAPGIRSIIDHDIDGWLCDTDTDSIKKSIYHLMTNSGYKRLGIMARHKALDLFNFNILLNKELDTYRLLSQ